ncbi:MAG: Smr/MutS family protein [Steroidobacteraceae bacterium]
MPPIGSVLMVKRRTAIPHNLAPAADDIRAFRAAVGDVKPLRQTPRPEGLDKPKAAARARKQRSPVVDVDATMPLIAVSESSAAGAAEPAGNLSYSRGGVRPQLLRRLRRGLIPIEDELDLHGLSQAAARERLAHFLLENGAAGRRCVRIIHGKGYRSGARGPVLKIAVDIWLRRHLDVLAFTSARAIDGGTGALYVLLRPG